MVEARINSDSFLNDGPRLTPIAQFGQIIKAWSQPQRLTLSSTVTLDPALRCRPPRLFFLPSTIIYHLFPSLSSTPSPLLADLPLCCWVALPVCLYDPFLCPQAPFMATTNLLTDMTADFPFDWPEIGTSSSGTDSSLELAPPSNPSRTPGQLFPGFYSTNSFPVASFQHHQFLPAPQEPNSYLFTPLDISAAPYSYPPPPGPPYSRRSLQEELNSDLPLEPSANIQSAYSQRVSYAQDDDSPSMIVPPSASVLSPLSPSSASSLPDSTRTRLSPVSVRSSNELPGTGTLRFDPSSQPPSPQTALPEGSPALTVEDSIVTFDSSVRCSSY